MTIKVGDEVQVRPVGRSWTDTCYTVLAIHAQDPGSSRQWAVVAYSSYIQQVYNLADVRLKEVKAQVTKVASLLDCGSIITTPLNPDLHTKITVTYSTTNGVIDLPQYIHIQKGDWF